MTKNEIITIAKTAYNRASKMLAQTKSVEDFNAKIQQPLSIPIGAADGENDPNVVDFNLGDCLLSVNYNSGKPEISKQVEVYNKETLRVWWVDIEKETVDII